MTLKPGEHIHFMGICGTAMASLAGLMKDRGFHVTGSDSNPYPPMSTQLEGLGISIQKGYRKENLQPRPDLVIVGNVISANNEEAQELMRLEIPYTSLPKAMGEFIIGDRQCICVSGTHGKTTTTSMMAWVANQMGLQPGFLIGGIPKNFHHSFQNPKGQFFVIEGDEYDTAFFDKVPKFIHYRPRHVIFTSCEFDHADIYKDLNAVKSAFAQLMHLIPTEGTLMACAEDANVMDLWTQCSAKSRFSYGIKKGDYQAHDIKVSDQGVQFQVQFRGLDLGRYDMAMSGDYNVLNATAVIGLAHQQGWDLLKLAQALKSFQGVKRRQEILGEPRGVLVIEDFAHHPTAVRETVKGILARYQDRKKLGGRLFAVFEPRSATSRRKIFQKDYAQAFQGCDETLIAQAYDQSKIDEENRFSPEELIADIHQAGQSAEVFSNADSIVEFLKQKTKEKDIVLIMSNGGFDNIYNKLLNALKA
ncbi:MAG: UDP-N-acetylmuramate:L-alanyl-gamma-D-glutamyl-meso-diaminopimelate ligase [Bdellovibrio sp. CG10_big_fil_rev_8_21_14_0_10_47_8]|nr:MAG: UDP-N-acetylmuramate:L-alanyl-gamma-D-glutamyl-meso-diaminopimelate ligase [Bdellovibrio sp. CG10_big_fil_rev_8_21_14_0_10_47_8]